MGSIGTPVRHTSALAHINVNRLLADLRDDIAALPSRSLDLVAALMAVQKAIPKPLSDWIYAELGKRTDLTVISPAAETLMRISATAFAQPDSANGPEIDAGVALLRALELEGDVSSAAAFLSTVAQRLQDNLCNKPTALE